jgi:cyclohexadieny/prephenate dehydrogenase
VTRVPDRLGPPRDAPVFNRLAIVGMGLIGSSIARAARALNLAGAIVAIDRDEAVAGRVRELGLADTVTTDAAAGVRDCDHVILCVPVGACGAVTAAIREALAPGAIVSDVGSVKASVVAQVQPHLPEGVAFVPAHPVAGTEHSGPDAGFPTLFLNRWCILTPPEGTPEAAVERVRDFWTAMGSNVETMSPEHHDLVLAITSHVPHLIAYNIVGTAADLETVTQSEVIKFSAGGFRDFTRIAASDPTMWRDIFLHNKGAVLEMLGRLNEDIALLARAIRWNDGETLFNLFTRTRAIRRSIITQGQETPEPDFGRRRGTEPPEG